MDILDDIKNGLGYKLLCEKFNLTYRQLYRIAKENNILDLFKKNNKQYKSRGEDHYWHKHSVLLYKKTEEKHWNTIVELVNNGANLAKIINEMNANATYLRNFLKWKNDEHLLKQLKTNSEKILKENAAKAGLLGAEKTRGKHQIPITKEIEKIYIKCKEKGFHRAKIDKILKKKGCGELKIAELAEKFGKPIRCDQSGKNNPMYGKNAPKGSGIGVKGWIIHSNKKLFCRSSLEMKIFYYLIDNNIEFKLSKHKIQYIDGNTNRNYFPDIVINDSIIEIKPSALVKQERNKLKFNALIDYCKKFNLKCEYFTEKSFDLEKYNKEFFINKIQNKELIIDEKNKEKLMRWVCD